MAILGEGLDDLESDSWTKRIARGTEVEKHLDELELRPRGLHGIEQRPMSRDNLHTRHYPDIGIQEIPGVLFQAVDGRRSGPHACVIKEQASIDGARAARNDGWRVCVIWEMPDGNFMGNLVERLDIVGPISDAARRKGSGTPAWRITKRSLVQFETLLAELR